MVKFYIANTDNDWFDYLSTQNDLAEVNFWQPSGRAFQAIETGEIFAFRLKSPRNKIGGFGILSNSSILPLQMAWETFGQSNGAPTYNVLRAAIARLRSDGNATPNTNIGCRVLTQPAFFPSYLWLDLPSTWAKNIVEGKRYSTDDPEALALWNRLVETAQLLSTSSPTGFAETSARYGTPTLIAPRLGQGAFRVAVMEAYQRRCAISDGKVLPTLDAAHIRPYGEGGAHKKSNGVLLRKDIHCVFDLGYVTIDPNYRFVVSNEVKERFDNGEEYRRLHGKILRRPNQRSDWPDPELLRWHNENKILG
jgi:putative restriction endonuclease